MKTIFLIIISIALSFLSRAQETLQTVTDRGNVTTNSLQIGGLSVNANTTKLFINNPSGKNFALSSGANMISEQGFHIYNWTDNPNSPLLSLSNNGYFGIGTANPSQPLTIPVTANAMGISLGTYSSLSAGQFAFVGITGSDGTFNGGNLTGGDNGSTGMAIIHTSGGYGNSAELAFVTHNNGADSRERLRIDRFGNVGIGTITPQEKLSINGKIRAHEIKVETANWPDYVFAKTYELPTLQETEKHIKEKGHLPGIPSAAEVRANGIDLGEMNAKLLQKIEELTLHLIEKDSSLKLQKEMLKKQQLQLTEQQEQINSIMKKLK